MEEKSYIGGIVQSVKSLGTGLKTTMREFFTPRLPNNTLRTVRPMLCLIVFAVRSQCSTTAE